MSAGESDMVVLEVLSSDDVCCGAIHARTKMLWLLLAILMPLIPSVGQQLQDNIKQSSCSTNSDCHDHCSFDTDCLQVRQFNPSGLGIVT